MAASSPGGATPPGWSGHSAVYDPVRDRLLVFGGAHPGQEYSNDVWALALSPAPAWQQVASAGGTPAARRDQAAVYDPVRDRLLVLCGATASGPVVDLWSLSLSGPETWNGILPAGGTPSPRSGEAAVYDPVRDRVLMFAGRTTGGVRMRDLWALELSPAPTWTSLIPPGSDTPGGRHRASFVYDGARDRMLVFGGEDSIGTRRDTWAFVPTGTPRWKMIVPDWKDRPLSQSFASDPATKRVFVLDGNNLWETNLGDPAPAWRRLAPAGPAPPARSRSTVVFDSRRDRFIAFSGSDFGSDTWALPLAPSSQWEQLSPGGSPPPGRILAAAVYDSLRDRMVLFGGQGPVVYPAPTVSYPILYGDAHALGLDQGGSWNALPAGPPARYDAGVAVDRVRNDLLMFGGAVSAQTGYPNTALGDLWRYDLEADQWSQIPRPAGGPHARWASILAVSPTLDELGIFGGAYFATPLADVWGYALDAAAWLPQDAMSSHDGGRNGLLHHRSAALPGRRRLVIEQSTHCGLVACLSRARRAAALGSRNRGLGGGIDQRARVPCCDGRTRLTDARLHGPRRSGLAGAAVQRLRDVQRQHCVTVGVPVPDTAAAGVVSIWFTGQLRSDPATRDSILTRMHDETTAALATFVDASVSADFVILRWYAEDGTYDVERRSGTEDYGAVAVGVRPDGAKQIVHEDRDVVPGRRYDYRLISIPDGAVLGETSIAVPASAFAFLGARPHPAVKTPTLAFTLARTGDVRCELFDVGGRRVLARILADLSPGFHTAPLETVLPPGVYLVRLTQGSDATHGRIVIVR